jgi:signal peptidase
MAAKGIFEHIRGLFQGKRLRGTAADIVLAVALIALACGALYAYAGVWPPMVSVGGTSMYPNLKNGDLVILRGLDRVGVVTGIDAINASYEKFGGYGDVIVYSPMGNRSVTPVIHRAIYYVQTGQPMWPDGPAAPWDGYITLGDNNFLYDQSSSISPDSPVRPAWIMGVSQLRLPFLGLVRSLLPV